MGSETSKLNSGSEIWYKIGKVKAKGKEPRMFKTVVQAIKDMKENTGSTQSKIVQYVQADIDSKNITPKPRAVVMQVKSALKYGVSSGVLKKFRGRFQLSLGCQDLSSYFNKQRCRQSGGLMERSRRGRKRKRSKGRRIRRSSKRKKRTYRSTLSAKKRIQLKKKIGSSAGSIATLDFEDIIDKYK